MNLNYNSMPNNNIFNPQENSAINNSPQMMGIKKRNSHKRIIFLIISIVLLILSIILFFFDKNKSSPKYPIYGKWNCITGIDSYTGSNAEFLKNADIKIDINEDETFEMYDYKDKNTLDVKGNLIINNITEEKEYTKYLLDMTTTDRTMNGQKYTDKYQTQYEIGFDNNSSEEFVMINTISESIYYCQKVK